MRKHVPKIVMVAGALLAIGPLVYALSRMLHVYMAGSSAEAIKTESAGVVLVCLLLVPFGLLAIAGGWLWKRNDEEVARENALLRQQKQRKRPPERSGKFAR